MNKYKYKENLDMTTRMTLFRGYDNFYECVFSEAKNANLEDHLITGAIVEASCLLRAGKTERTTKSIISKYIQKHSG